MQLDPHLLVTFLPQFESYRDELKQKKGNTTEESHIRSSVSVLIDYLRKDYRSSLASIAKLTSRGEITFELLYAILVPRSILITECPITREPRAVHLVSSTEIKHGGIIGYYDLLCESVDAANLNTVADNWNAHSAEAEVNKAGAGKAYGWIQHRIIIPFFRGTMKISALDAYPIKYHHAPEELKKRLVARGRKWAKLRGVHHMQYKGTATWQDIFANGSRKVYRYKVSNAVRIYDSVLDF